MGCDGDDLTAPETGEVAVTTSTTGSPADSDGYTIVLDGGPGPPIGSNGSLNLTLPTGDHTVALTGLAANCAVQGEARLSVRVVGGEVTPAAFVIVCSELPRGGLAITTTTTGGGGDPDGYTIRLDDGPEHPIGPNATLTIFGVPPGSHSLALGGIAPDCQVAGDNPRAVEVPAGDPVAVPFEVACIGGVERWTRMTSGTNADLADVWGSSASDVFAVGEFPVGEDFEVASVILRYDGTMWARQHRETDLVLRAVWGSSSADVYAVGNNPFLGEARLLRYDGNRWTNVPGFVSEDFEELGFESVWGSSATDVFAVGSAFDGVFDHALIFHFDGSAWRRMPQPSPVDPGLVDVWGSSPTDVYAVGRDDIADPATAVILHYDGTAWSPVFEEEELALNSIWGSSATDVFAAGFRVEGGNGDVEVIGTVLHYDGNAWTPMRLPRAGVLQSLWGTSATDVFAVGDDGVILHYDGSEWTRRAPTNSALLGVWAASRSEAFAVGTGGTILRGTP